MIEHWGQEEIDEVKRWSQATVTLDHFSWMISVSFSCSACFSDELRVEAEGGKWLPWERDVVVEGEKITVKCSEKDDLFRIVEELQLLLNSFHIDRLWFCGETPCGALLGSPSVSCIKRHT